MRSRSLASRNAPTISRKSTAIGWRRAIVSTAFSSISRCKASILASAAVTRCASAVSRLASASTEIGDLLFGEAAHFGDHAGEILQVGVESLGGVLIGHCCRPSVHGHRSAEAAGDVVLGTAVVRRR